MEKIMNMKVQAGASVPSTISRQARNSVQDTKDDFIRLLQQQNESSGRPEKAENVKETKDVKDAEKPEEKQPEEAVEEQLEETEGQEILPDLTQMELQQSIFQQTVVQIAEPSVTDQQVIPETGSEVADIVVPEAIAETGEPLKEASVITKQSKTESVKSDSENPVPEEKLDLLRTDEEKPDLQRSDKPDREVRISNEGFQESSAAEQRLSDSVTVSSEKSKTVRSSEKMPGEDLPEAETGPSVLAQTAETPVQTGRTQHVSQNGIRETENTVKSTVEELPQTLGKVLTSGKAGNGQVLTVELEPVSLGKLTIRLEYEAGKTMVSVMSSNPKTLEMLNEKVSEIAAILKEHTGEETVIYTEQPQKEPGEEAQERQNRGGQQQERQQHRQEEQPQTDSFMQQLRLGLV